MQRRKHFKATRKVASFGLAFGSKMKIVENFKPRRKTYCKNSFRKFKIVMPSFNSRVMWHARNILSKVAKRYRVGIIIWHNASRGIVVSTFIPHWTISAILNDSNPFEPILTHEICYFFAHRSFDSLRSRKCLNAYLFKSMLFFLSFVHDAHSQPPRMTIAFWIRAGISF